MSRKTLPGYDLVITHTVPFEIQSEDNVLVIADVCYLVTRAIVMKVVEEMFNLCELNGEMPIHIITVQNGEDNTPKIEIWIEKSFYYRKIGKYVNEQRKKTLNQLLYKLTLLLINVDWNEEMHRRIS